MDSHNADKHDSLELNLEQPQHELIKTAFGSIVADSTNLTQPDFRALDVQTGNGYWLHDLRSQLRYPDEADLVGTDHPSLLPAEQRPFPIPHNMRFLAQDPAGDWPEDIHGYFDLVHNRRVLASSAGSFETAVDITARLLRLVKPGGSILLVDCCFEPGGRVVSSDRREDEKNVNSQHTPSRKLFQLLGNAFSSHGMEGTLGGDLPAILDVASHKSGVRLIDVGLKKSESRIGEGAEGQLKDLGLAWLAQLKEERNASCEKADLDRIDGVVAEAIEEANTKGFDVTWYATWATRSGGDAGGAIEMPA
jgi:hypothetical protein